MKQSRPFPRYATCRVYDEKSDFPYTHSQGSLLKTRNALLKPIGFQVYVKVIHSVLV